MIKMYGSRSSPPCRLVMMGAKLLGVELDLLKVDPFEGGHLAPEYSQVNPLNTIPTMVEKETGLMLTESRTILRYLVNKYKNGDSPLYPAELVSRARVEQYLEFDLGRLYTAYWDYYYPVHFKSEQPNPKLYKKLERLLRHLDACLEGKEYLVGSQLTLADLALVVTISNVELIENILNNFHNIQRWYKHVADTTPGYDEINGEGVRLFRQAIDNMKIK